MTESAKCKICNQTEEWHRKHKPKHAFTTDGQLHEADYDDGPLSPQKSGPPFDPALRMALIEKGILTPEEIDTAHKKLLAIQGTGGMVVAQDPQAEPTPAQDWKAS